MSVAIQDVLKRFCVSMFLLDMACFPINQARHTWSGKENDVYKFDISIELPREWVRGVFSKFCVPGQHPIRDFGVGADPPDYHPDYFDILEITIKGKKATAKVRQPALGRMAPSKGGGIVPMVPKTYTYYLKLTDDGWRLEDRRDSYFENSGEVVKTVL